MQYVSTLSALTMAALLVCTAACKKENQTSTGETANAAEAYPGATARDSVAADGVGAETTAPDAAKPVTPFRTFVMVQRYTLEKSGNKSNAISNARLEVTFPNGGKLPLPEGGQFWPISDGQVQEINRTYEIPWNLIQKDGFRFAIQMVRKGSPMLPCEFDVRELSQFNRAYICKTDVGWQTAQNIPTERQAVEGIQVRVFTDRNSDPKEIPQQAIAANK